MAGPDVPNWLTTDFLKACLQSDDENPKQLTITSHTVESAVPAGNNYGSIMLRVKIQYKDLNSESKAYEISLIVKAPLTSGIAVELSDDFKTSIYEREPMYYREFIAETYKLCKHNLVPKYYTSPNPLCVVLEDLKASGYVMPDRHKLLDFDQAQAYIKAAAKLQAMSVAVYKKNPEVIDSVINDKGVMTQQLQQMMKVMLLGGLRCMAAYLEDKPKYKDCLDVIKEAIKNDKAGVIFDEMEKPRLALRALIQGDPWCTNMMFKYNNLGEVVGVKIFDFQSLKFNSPVMEFITFVWVSVNPDVRKVRLHDLYHLYLDSLNESLAEFGCSERLSFEQLKAEIASLTPMVLLCVCTMLPVCVADGVADISDYITGKILNIPVQESPIYKLFQGTTFNKYYPQVFDQVAKEGVFDYMTEKMMTM